VCADRPLVLVATSLPGQARLLLRLVNEAVESECVVVTSGHQVLDYSRQRVYDLSILSADLTGIDGHTVCHRLRQLSGWQRAPVIILGTKGLAELKYRAFYVGATDYMEWPFDALEFVWRVRVQLRHCVRSTDEATILECPPHRLEASTRLVYKEGRAIALTPSEFRLAWTLASQSNQWITVGQLLLDALKRSQDGRSLALLHTHIRNLRKKLESDPHQPQILLATNGAYQWRTV